MSRVLAGFLALAFVPAAYGQGPVPSGGERQVNSYTAGGQDFPSVASLAGGGYVVTWVSEGSSGSDASGTSIQAQRYAADGKPLGGEFQVNSSTSGDQQAPSVAALVGGGFVVVWRDELIRSQSFAADGSALAGEIQVTGFEFGETAVAPLADGGFAVLWINVFFPDNALNGRRYTADGSAMGDAFFVAYDVDTGYYAVASLADGSFVVAWNSGNFDSYNIWGQRYVGDSPEGSVFRVNSDDRTIRRGSVSLAADSEGGFVATWSSGERRSGADTNIAARRFGPDGVPAGPEFQVNPDAANHQLFPVVATEDDGGFVIAWQSGGSNADSSGYSVQGRRYAADVRPLGGELQLNSVIAGDQLRPSVASLRDGGFAAAWQSDASSGSDVFGTSIQSRRFTPPRFSLVGLAGKCLDVEGGVSADGTPANLSRCLGAENQTWRLELTDLPQRVVGIGGKCLVPGPPVSSGFTRLVIGECGGPGDLWRLQDPDHAAASTLIHLETGLCLDVRRAETADGTETILFRCHERANQLWRPAAEVCTRDSEGSCLGGDRFRVEVDWRDHAGNTGTSRVVPAGSDDSGLLWFFHQDNWEMLIKVLDGCGLNDRYWVFAAATTDVEYTLRVTDTAGSAVSEYFNPLGTASPAVTDTGAFATCSLGTAPDAVRARPVAPSLPVAVEPSPDGGGTKGQCVPSPDALCLSDGRFRAEVEWRDPAGNRGFARAVPVESRNSGLLWFFDESNWEMLVKVLNGCDLNGRYWVFAAATTDVEYTLWVTDLDRDVTREYFNRPGTASPAITDTGAFATCP